MITIYRFDNEATLHKAILTSDDEQIRPAVKGTTFQCFEQSLKVKGVSTILDGASQGTASLTIQTDDEIALEIEADDYVEYEGHRYVVASVGAVRSSAFKGAREYLIGLI